VLHPTISRSKAPPYLAKDQRGKHGHPSSLLRKTNKEAPAHPVSIFWG